MQFIAQEPDYIFQPTVEKGPEKVKKSRNLSKGNWNTGQTARTLKKQLSGDSGTNGAASFVLTTTLPIGNRARGRSTTRPGPGNRDMANTLNSVFSRRLNTGPNTPSVTDNASEESRSRLGSRVHASDDDEDSDEPLSRGRTLSRADLSRFAIRSSRNPSTTGWEIEGSEEEDDYDNDESDTQHRSASGNNIDDNDIEDEEEEDYAPIRGKQRRRVAGSLATAAGKRRKMN